MDAHRFDSLARTLSTTGSRRVALAVGGSGIGALLGLAGITAGESKKKRKKKNKKKKLRCNMMAGEIPCPLFGGSCCDGFLGETCTTCGCCPAQTHTLCCIHADGRHNCCQTDWACCWGPTGPATCCPPGGTCCRKDDGTYGLNACCIEGTTCCNGVCCINAGYACTGGRCCSTLPGPQFCLPG